MDLNVTTKEITESGASMGETLAIQKIQPSGTLAYRLLKRLFDFVFSLCVSVVLCIPIAVVCAFICFESSGSPVYAQERVGKGGKTIKILKLRSMVTDAGCSKNLIERAACAVSGSYSSFLYELQYSVEAIEIANVGGLIAIEDAFVRLTNEGRTQGCRVNNSFISKLIREVASLDDKYVLSEMIRNV